MASRKSTFVFVILLAAIVAFVITSSFLLIRVGTQAADISRERTGERYKWHIMMIGKRVDSSFWQDVYSGAREAGEEKSAIVELIGPMSDADGKDLAEYIDYAVATRVNGILAYVSDGGKTVEPLARARENGIPLITLDNDSVHSSRQSFVGVSSYELGKTIGELIGKQLGATGNALVFLEDDVSKFSEQIMFSGIRESLAYFPRLRIGTATLDSGKGAGNDENIRQKILNDKDLDVIVTLNVEDTMRAVQTILELNLSDSISVIAFRESPEILEYARKGVISAVIAIDARQMGRQAVEAMLEYLETGNSNDYVITDMHVITRETMEENDK